MGMYTKRNLHDVQILYMSESTLKCLHIPKRVHYLIRKRRSCYVLQLRRSSGRKVRFDPRNALFNDSLFHAVRFIVELVVATVI